MNTTVQSPVTVGVEPIREVESFVYLGVGGGQTGDTDQNVKSRIGKARVAFTMLKNILPLKDIRMTTKLQILSSNIKFILLYRVET